MSVPPPPRIETRSLPSPAPVRVSLPAGAPNTILISSGTIIDLTAPSVAAGYDIVSVSGNDNSGFIYGAPDNALYLGGSGNLFAVLANASASGATGSVLSVSGADTPSVWSGNNSIYADNGAAMFVTADNNSIGGSNINLTLQGEGNTIDLTGQSTVSDEDCVWSSRDAGKCILRE